MSGQEREKVMRILPYGSFITKDMTALVKTPNAQTSAKCLALWRV